MKAESAGVGNAASGMRFSWGFIYGVLWIYRSAYSYLGQVVVATLTTLGDSSQFQRADQVERNINLLSGDLVGAPRSFSTEVTETLGTFLFRVTGGDPVLINICFQTIAFVGIVVFLRTLRGWHRAVVLMLLAFPTFSLWSSVAGRKP